jgi:hypothetical protein
MSLNNSNISLGISRSSPGEKRLSKKRYGSNQLPPSQNKFKTRNEDLDDELQDKVENMEYKINSHI